MEEKDEGDSTHFPSRRGLRSGGREPGAKLSGTSAAAPAPPPTQPSIGASHSMPSDVRPPTFRFCRGISSTTAPTIATTTREPSATFPALVTMVTSLCPTSMQQALSLSLMASTLFTNPHLMPWYLSGVGRCAKDTWPYPHRHRVSVSIARTKAPHSTVCDDQTTFSHHVRIPVLWIVSWLCCWTLRSTSHAGRRRCILGLMLKVALGAYPRRRRLHCFRVLSRVCFLGLRGFILLRHF